MQLFVKKLHPDAILPKYALPKDAGMDLFALEETIIQPAEKKIIRTGVAIKLPENTVGLIWDKSSMAAKHHLHTLGGVIDEQYRGEYLVIMVNLGEKSHTIEKGQKFAQLLIQPVVHCQIEAVDELDETARGEGRFGSTGAHS